VTHSSARKLKHVAYLLCLLRPTKPRDGTRTAAVGQRHNAGNRDTVSHCKMLLFTCYQLLKSAKACAKDNLHVYHLTCTDTTNASATALHVNSPTLMQQFQLLAHFKSLQLQWHRVAVIASCKLSHTSSLSCIKWSRWITSAWRSRSFSEILFSKTWMTNKIAKNPM